MARSPVPGVHARTVHSKLAKTEGGGVLDHVRGPGSKSGVL